MMVWGNFKNNAIYYLISERHSVANLFCYQIPLESDLSKNKIRFQCFKMLVAKVDTMRGRAHLLM